MTGHESNRFIWYFVIIEHLPRDSRSAYVWYILGSYLHCGSNIDLVCKGPDE